MIRVLLLLTLGVAAASAQFVKPEPPRTWTPGEGPPFTASLMTFDGTLAVLRMPNGQRAQLPLLKMGDADRQFLVEWQKNQPIKVVMPESVGVDASALRVETVSEDPKKESFIYRTPHFQLESQGKLTQSLLREVGRDFEATYELVKALPWGVVPKPSSGTLFQARLMMTEADYRQAGGPVNSGGVYLPSGVFLVPFANLGIKPLGKSYTKDNRFDSHTMVHELTHQMMHFWLDYLPQWIVEGTAEYTSTLPLRDGRFRVSAYKTGLRDYMDYLRLHGGVPMTYPIDEVFGITHKKWNEILSGNPETSHRLYFTSFLLVYYFMHLDGDGSGQLFARYFREVDAVVKQVEDYRDAWEEFKKSPNVEKLADGRYRWHGVKPPEEPEILKSEEALADFQKRTLAILLNGRTEEELMKQIRSAYNKLGVKI